MGRGESGGTVLIGKNTLNLSHRSAIWVTPHDIPVVTWTCGFCGESVASAKGWFAAGGGSTTATEGAAAYIRLCPNCDGPTLFTWQGYRYPGSSPGRPVRSVPDDITALYEEARNATAAGAYTAAVMVCRKILMHIAVDRGAKPDLRFVQYVQHLKATNHIPPNGDVWVTYIKDRGNEANHEIELMREEDAIALVTFVEMLLRFIYEFPSLVPPPPVAAEAVPVT